MLHNCLTDCNWKGMQPVVTLNVIQGHHRCCHLIGHIWFLSVFHCEYISILHRFCDINNYLPKSKDVTWPWPRPLGGQFVVTRLILLSQIVQKIWRFYVHSLQRNLRACKILKWITWPRPRPFQGQSAIRRLKFDITCEGTKFDNSSFSSSRDISRGVKF